MEHDKPWLGGFPAADNAEELLQRQLIVFRNEVGAARRDDQRAGSIRDSLGQWRENIDTTGVPKEVLTEADRFVEVAREALRPIIHVDEAQGALMQAQRLFAP